MRKIIFLSFLYGTSLGQEFYDLCAERLDDFHIATLARTIKELKKAVPVAGTIVKEFSRAKATIFIQEGHVDIYKLKFPQVPDYQSTLRISFDEILQVARYMESINKR